MNEKDHVQNSIERAKEWFSSHVASIPADRIFSNIEPYVINWRSPDTGNYAMQFIIHRNYLVVLGDVGEAVYGWGQPLTLEFLKNCDWHYFAGKCVASETGRNYTMKVLGIKSPVVNVRAIGHHLGLQMAITQLLDVKTPPPD